jgi:hypothetical protein
MGADVVKVEPPDGDINRQTGPGRNPGMGALYLNINRNKRSIALDLKRPGAADICAGWSPGRTSSSTTCATAPPGRGSRRRQSARGEPAPRPLLGFRLRQRRAYADRRRSTRSSKARAALRRLRGGRTEGALSPRARRGQDHRVTLACRLAGLFARERSGEGQVVEVPMLETMVHFTMV